MILNMVDADDPAYIPKAMVDIALGWMREVSFSNRRLFVHCNQGESRGPTMMMMFLAPLLPEDFHAAEVEFKDLCPSYNPKAGVRGFAAKHWGEYHEWRRTDEPPVS